MNLQKRLHALPKRWLMVPSIIALAGIIAASCHDPHPQPPTPPVPCCSPPTSPTPPPKGLPQWTQQHGQDVTALLDAVKNDWSQINLSLSSCNSNSQFCIAPDCSDTTAAANKLQSDPAPPDANIANALSAGALELSMAAGQCASVQAFIQGYANITNAAQALGMPSGG
jgi:hypothetical protein